METSIQKTDSNAELLQMILENERKQLRYTRMRFYLSASGALLAIIALVILLCGVLYVKKQATLAFDTLSQTAQKIDEVTEKLKVVDFAALEETYKNFGELGTETILLLEDGLGGLKDVMDDAKKALEGLNSVDMDTLNKGIEKLNDVLTPLADFFGKLRR